MSQGIVVLHGDAYAHEEMDLTDDSAQSITASNLYSGDLPAKTALVSVSANTINMFYHGGTPTNTAGTDAGHAMVAGTSFVLEGFANIKNFKAINRVATTDGIVKITLST